MDIYHKLFLVVRREKLHSPHYTLRNERDTRILDLGCGTGIWAIDMAEYVKIVRNGGAVLTFCSTYWHGTVHGVDLEFIQPAT